MKLVHLKVLEFRGLRLGDPICLASDEGLLNISHCGRQQASMCTSVDMCVDETTWKERKRNDRMWIGHRSYYFIIKYL